MAEPIQMQFGMLSWVGTGNMYYNGNVDAPTHRGTFGGIRPIEKHCKASILEVV